MLRPAVWNHVKKLQVAVTLSGILFLVLFFAHSEKKFLPVLDHANLIFHEAGHPLFSLFGETIGFLGGTIGQLFFPTVVSISFWFKKEPVGFCIGTSWFFQNFMNIARYMADAREQSLPLLGGGVHDWTYLFSRWGVLPFDTKIAGVVESIGYVGLAGSGFWLAWVWWFQVEPDTGNALDEGKG